MNLPMLGLVLLSVIAEVQSHAQEVGPMDRSCFSSFVAGYSKCPADPKPTVVEPQRTASQPAPSKDASQVTSTQVKTPKTGVSESDIDAYLANYGKPTRESARAMLDPTDENIAAMARSIRQQTATASYVGTRLTNLQQVDPGLVAINPSFSSEDLPYLSGMRVVLHTVVGCKECDRAVVLLQRLVAESPILDARIVVHGVSDPKSLLLEMGRIGITLPATAATPTQAKYAKYAPIALGSDTRYGNESLISEFKNTQELRTALANIRKSSLTKGSK